MRRRLAFIFLILVLGLVIQTGAAHTTFWESDCAHSVCCSSGSSDSDTQDPFSQNENQCHPFDSCHSCFHLLSKALSLQEAFQSYVFVSPLFVEIIWSTDKFPYEGPPPK